ncbi:hypothetical protein BDZ89DRAFT_213412 [Hymenopellis radicata]|nr:hypothetical protein BDZ89DRAFT_213412 [Hymenopellis radicata]
MYSNGETKSKSIVMSVTVQEQDRIRLPSLARITSCVCTDLLSLIGRRRASSRCSPAFVCSLSFLWLGGSRRPSRYKERIIRYLAPFHSSFLFAPRAAALFVLSSLMRSFTKQ